MKFVSTVVLPPLSLIYSLAIRTRLKLYERGILRIDRLGIPVISIGNLTTGGTGKTPLVETACRILAEANRKVCVLTRGYRRPDEKSRLVVSDGTKVFADPFQAGDEPFLLAERLLGLAAVICDPNRVSAGKWAIKEFGIEVFVLDDGFQHLRLFRDLNIVAIDATDPWGSGALLPYGRLREPVSGLNRADCVVITRANSQKSLAPLKSKIEATLSGRPVVMSHMRTCAIKPMPANGVMKDGAEILKPIGAFCGIGNPDAFFCHLEGDGFKLVFKRTFHDHHSYSNADVDLIIADAKNSGVKTLFTTAKDAVKLRSCRFEMPVLVVEIEPVFPDDRFRDLILSTIRT